MDEFDDDAVAAIVRRAVELDTTPHEAAAGIDRASLVRAATEAGIDRSAIERAIAEHRLRPVPDRGRLDVVVGPRVAVGWRQVDRPAHEVESALTAWLTSARFRPLRRESGFTMWERRTDLAAGVHRAASSLVGGGRFRGAARIEVEVVPVDEQRTLVQLRGDRAGARGAALSGSAASVGVAGVAGVLLGGSGLVVLSLPLAAAAVAIALGTKEKTRRTTSDFDQLLDQVAASEQPNLLGVARSPRAVRRRPVRPQL